MRLHPKHEDTPCASTEDILPSGWSCAKFLFLWMKGDVRWCVEIVKWTRCRVLSRHWWHVGASCVVLCGRSRSENIGRQWWAADIQHPFSEKSWRELFCIPHRSEQLNCTSNRTALVQHGLTWCIYNESDPDELCVQSWLALFWCVAGISCLMVFSTSEVLWWC